MAAAEATASAPPPPVAAPEPSDGGPLAELQRLFPGRVVEVEPIDAEPREPDPPEPPEAPLDDADPDVSG